MKTRNILVVLMFYICTLGFAQSTYQNYTTETIYKNGRNPSGIFLQTNTNFITTTYYDGLGRPIQQVQQNASPVGDKNIVTHIEYDKNIGQTKKYLPFTAEGKVTTTINNPFGPPTTSTTYNSNFISDAKVNTLTFYQTYNDYTENPYSETRLENSPNQRVLETGAPGYEWSISVNEGYGVPEEERNTIRYKYDFNTVNEVKKYLVNTQWDSTREVFTSSIAENGFYPVNSLSKTITKNENWKPADGLNNTTEEFKGTDGKVLLKRTYNSGNAHDIYYAYDFYGNLAYVIPPLANGSIAGDNLDNLCYQYLYDEKNRLVEKKLPQKQWEYIVYDKADRIVMTGPVNNPLNASAASGWIMTKYDSQSRTLYTGFYNGHVVNSENRKAMKTAVYAQTDNNEAKSVSNTTIDGVITRYTNTKFPTVFNLLTVNYYDDYQFPNAPSSFAAVQGVTPVQNLKGLSTGSWTRVITTATERKADISYTLYNSKYQPIRTYTTNYLNGYIQTDNVLTFRGIPTQTITAQKKDAAAALLTVTNNFVYDHRERLKTNTQQLNGGTAKLIVENTYDELGVLTNKKVGNSTSTPLQKVDYKYNIRGWLTDINNADYHHVDTENDLFNFKINYIGGAGGGRYLYNGNIHDVISRTKTDNLIRGYAYYYDDLNRMVQAKGLYYETGGWMIGVRENSSYQEAVSYDKSGNILTMNRTSELVSGQPVQIDDLTYTYTANQLQTVTDATNSSEGFNDGNKIGVDYTYDAFGNLKTDKNKGITNITYNHLNLPVEITFTTGKITYTYDATGTKVKKVVQPNSGVAQTTDYQYGFQYLNGALQFFPHAEGYIKPNGTNSYLYVYQYKDHLGNVRLSYADCDGNGTINPATEILEENNYYPFGLQHQGYNDIANSCRNEEAEAYKYNGKEYEDNFGLNIYEMDLRQYDPAIGRWTVMDPVTHHDYSPYSAFDNNPVFWSDPSGADSQTDWLGRDKFDPFGVYINPLDRMGGDMGLANFYTWDAGEDSGYGGDDGDGGGNSSSKKSGGGLWSTIKSWFTGKPKYTSVTVLVGPFEDDFQEGIPCVECHHTTMIPNGKKMGDLAGGTGSIHFLGISSFNLEGKGEIDGKRKYIKVTDMNSFGGANLAARIFLFRVADGIQMVNSITGTGVSLSEDTNVRVMFYNTGSGDSLPRVLTPSQNSLLREQSPKAMRFRDSIRGKEYFNTFK